MNRLCCAVCGAPGGQVTLMNVEGQGYICFGGDCQKQKLIALKKRLLRRGRQRATAEKPAGQPKKRRPVGSIQ